MVSGSVTSNWSAGSQQITVLFSNAQLLGLATNGPYERISALLVHQGISGYYQHGDLGRGVAPRICALSSTLTRQLQT